MVKGLQGGPPPPECTYGSRIVEMCVESVGESLAPPYMHADKCVRMVEQSELARSLDAHGVCVYPLEDGSRERKTEKKKKKAATVSRNCTGWYSIEVKLVHAGKLKDDPAILMNYICKILN